jgi:hypothetical protein
MSNRDLLVKRVGNAPVEEEPQKTNNSPLGTPLTGTKALYIVVVEDPSSKPKFRVYGTAKPDKTPGYLEISTGYDLTKLTKAQLEQLRTYEDVIELGKEGKVELVNITFPWQRIISIKNVSFGYKAKSA